MQKNSCSCRVWTASKSWAGSEVVNLQQRGRRSGGWNKHDIYIIYLYNQLNGGELKLVHVGVRSSWADDQQVIMWSGSLTLTSNLNPDSNQPVTLVEIKHQGGKNQTDRQTKKGTEKHNWETGNRKRQVRNRVRTKHRVKAKVNLKSFFFNSLWSSIQNKCVRWSRVLFLWNSKPHYSSSQKCSQLHLCYNSTFLWLTPSVGVTADTLKNTGGLETLEALPNVHVHPS